MNDITEKEIFSWIGIKINQGAQGRVLNDTFCEVDENFHSIDTNSNLEKERDHELVVLVPFSSFFC